MKSWTNFLPLVIVCILLFATVLITNIFFRSADTLDNKKTFQKTNNENNNSSNTSQKTYYTQIFDNDPGEIIEEGEVSLNTTKELVASFYQSGFKKGEHFIIGFSDPQNNSNFIEFSKNDSGKVSLIRLNISGKEILEETKVDVSSGLQYLTNFWNQ